MVIPPLIGNPYNGHINPYYWVDDHPLLKGNNGEFRPWHMYWFITISSPTHRNSFEAWSEQTHWFGKVCWINRFPSISFKPVSGQTDIFNKVNKATTFPPWSSPWLSQKHQRYTLTGSHSKTLQIQLYTCRLMVVIWMFPKIGVPPKWMVYNGKPTNFLNAISLLRYHRELQIVCSKLPNWLQISQILYLVGMNLCQILAKPLWSQPHFFSKKKHVKGTDRQQNLGRPEPWSAGDLYLLSCTCGQG